MMIQSVGGKLSKMFTHASVNLQGKLQSKQSINSPIIKKTKTKSTEPTPSISKSITDSLEEFLQSSSDEETHALSKDAVQMIENYHQEKRLDTNQMTILSVGGVLIKKNAKCLPTLK